MSILVDKGSRFSLSKEVPELNNIAVGLGWDVRTTDGANFDLDASVFLLGVNNLVRSEKDIVFYNQLKSSCGSIQHTGDNLTGVGDGDDETILVNLEKIPSDVHKLVFTVTIHEYEKRKQNFGQVKNAFIRLVDRDNNKEILRYDLAEEASTETAMIFGEIYRYNNEWKFSAVGQGYSGGLGALCKHFGLKI